MTNQDLRRDAMNVRRGIIDAVFAANSGHPGGSLSCADILTALYRRVLRPSDKLILSKGHAAPALYSVLALVGKIPYDELKTLRKFGSRLQGHPDMHKAPGVDMSTGSLGQGISAACGLALGAKVQGIDSNVYAILGDGECQEGQVWEALMFAAHHKLTNLTVIVDANRLQIDGKVADVMNVEPLADKLRAFGLDVLEICGHDFDSIIGAIEQKSDGVKALVCYTTKGKGVSFMEGNAGWHGKAPTQEEYDRAMAELEAMI